MHLAQENEMLTPTRDGDVRGDAWSVWEKFYDRKDVNKKTLDLYDSAFRFDLLSGDEVSVSDEEKKEWWNDEMTDDDRHSLKVFNTGYNMKPDDNYKILVDRSKQYGQDMFKLAFDAASQLWDEKYD